MKTIKYNPEWECFPFWDADGDNISVQELDLSSPLMNEVVELDNYFQSLYNRDDPANSRFPNIEVAKAFAQRMIVSAKALEDELSGQYTVVFDYTYWQALLNK